MFNCIEVLKTRDIMKLKKEHYLVNITFCEVK